MDERSPAHGMRSLLDRPGSLPPVPLPDSPGKWLQFRGWGADSGTMPHPWLEKRRLGEILVERGLLTDGGLRRALDEQARTGRLLGEILIERGWISAAELADALAEQDVPSAADADTDAPRPPTRPLIGRLLIEKGLITEPALAQALETQRSRWRPIGQILVGMGVLSQQDLARTLTEQNGFDFLLGLRARLASDGTVQLDDGDGGEPPTLEDFTEPVDTYLVREPGSAEPLHVATALLDAADAAFELIDDRDPSELEIVRAGGDGFEVIWSYTRPSGDLRGLGDRLGAVSDDGRLASPPSLELIRDAGEDHPRLEEQ